jgi:hypothetical protein
MLPHHKMHSPIPHIVLTMIKSEMNSLLDELKPIMLLSVIIEHRRRASQPDYISGRVRLPRQASMVEVLKSQV